MVSIMPKKSKFTQKIKTFEVKIFASGVHPKEESFQQVFLYSAC